MDKDTELKDFSSFFPFRPPHYVNSAQDLNLMMMSFLTDKACHPSPTT